ncbi:Lipid II flippase FtsW [Candidatus Providencia siddallii]|uniref:Probable peptidoglycan glycosyltransferase FtsW n=1 Tax=Candidatus Providencia siddallii TaxID=1715285 RepID=A0A0M6W943_9GAMM|nr:Lipid II flippase FtsW [Candidatus Providencia siddallii]
MISKKNLYDYTLILIAIGLTAIGFIMVISASMPIGQRLMEDPFYFAKRDILYIIFAFILSLIVIQISITTWEKYNFILLVISIVMLTIVLFTGNSINGASRWINIGIIKIQPSEFSKLALFCYISSYLNRNSNKIKIHFLNFIKPIYILIIMSVLLLLQPDFGAVIILIVTTFGILFLAGTRLTPFFIGIVMNIIFILGLIWFKPYRWRRITSFLNPWEDPFGSGYQLTQSLMAFGRGDIFGQGLGNSIQKLEFLPEAHTDFIFSILAEELGFIGVTFVLFMIFSLTYKAIKIGQNALTTNNLFSGYLACSIGIWFIFQSLLNIGGVSGILPTKGLTMPLISYGGSSLLVMSTAISLLLRIDFETRIKKKTGFNKEL